MLTVDFEKAKIARERLEQEQIERERRWEKAWEGKERLIKAAKPLPATN